jgi:hypothetical protein
MIAGLTRSTHRTLLPLLPSGPDGVHTPPLHRARLSISAHRGSLGLTGGMSTVSNDSRPDKKDTVAMVIKWRREGDSNPRYTFVGIHTISSRAPSAARTSLHCHGLDDINGGERGIRTPVRAFGPQIDFESIPLRPLRYLSA